MKSIKSLLALSLSLFLLSCVSPPPAPSKKLPKAEARKAPPGVGVRAQKNPGTTSPTTIAADSPVKTAQALFDAKNFEKFFPFVKASLETPGLSQVERESLWTMRMKAWEETNDVNAFSVAPMSESELVFNQKLQLKSQFSSMNLLKLAEGKILEQKTDDAKIYLNQILAADPGGESSAKAQEYLKSLNSVQRVSPKTVGVVLPLTGKNSRIAQRTLRGIQLGLGLNGKAQSSFSLAVIDSEGSPELARKGVERLYNEDNVIAVIGGLVSKTASAEAAQANEMSLPTVTLSLKPGITDFGPSVFRSSLTLEMQVRQLVKTAMEIQGFKRFGILYPNDSYGIEAANLFWDEVLARGGQVHAAQTYSPKDTDYRDVIQRLIGTYFSEARPDEVRLRMKELNDSTDRRAKGARSSTREDLLAPVVQFEALFIPDGLKALGQMTATLAYSDVRNITLLGTNLWNSPELTKRAGSFANSVLFVDSYAATEMNFQSLLFVKEYKQLFNEDPGLFEIQGYDAGLVIRQLVSQGATDRQALTQALKGLSQLPGLLSPLSATEDREILRPVSALTAENGQIVPLRAPKSKK